MRRLLLIILATMPLGGCQYLSAGEDVAIIDPLEAVDGVVAATNSNAEADSDSEAFEDPTVEAEPVAVVTPDLIRSTDPEARLQQVAQSRPDPFASLPIPPPPEPVELPRASGNNAGSGNGGNGNNGGSSAGANNGAGAAAAAQPSQSPPEPTPPPVRVQDNNEPLVTPSPIAALPPIPQPVIAPTVSVSGIIQLGGEPYAIVSAGNEPERYVRVGDRIGGGSVRVKRIDTLAFEPRVILEENGIEVSRPVNAGRNNDEPADAEAGPVATAPAPATPVAALPAPTISDVPEPTLQPAISQISLPTVPTPTAATLSPAAATGNVPDSLLLTPEEAVPQATLPNLQIEVPSAG